MSDAELKALEDGQPNALDPMDPALLIHNLVGLRQLLDIERGSNWQGRCHFLNQVIRTVQHLEAERKADGEVWIDAATRPDTRGDLWLAVDGDGRVYPGVYVNHRIPDAAVLVQKIDVEAIRQRLSAHQKEGR